MQKQPATNLTSSPTAQAVFLNSGLVFFKYTQNRGVPYVLLGTDPENDNKVVYVRNTNIRNDGGLRRNCTIITESLPTFRGYPFMPKLKRIVAVRALNMSKIRESYPGLVETTPSHRYLSYFQSPEQDIRSVSRNYTL